MLQCALCGVGGKLSTCQGCHVITYCGRDHQTSHWAAHKKACNAIKRSQKALNKEEQRLRNLPGDFMTPDNLFEEHRGQFWGILETRTYMRNRYDLIDSLLKIKTFRAVQTAQEYLMECLYLCRSDNMGVRDLVPAVDLRLGRDQECYDFCKWWATAGSDSHYDFGELSNPYLDYHGGDVFEPVKGLFVREYTDLSHTIAITLVKIRALFTLRATKNAELLLTKVPEEMVSAIQDQIVKGTTVERRKDIYQNKKARAEYNMKLQAQIEELWAAVDKHNQYFWPALMDPANHLEAMPEYTSQGSLEEMQVALQHSYDAWMETDGAIDVIDILECLA